MISLVGRFTGFDVWATLGVELPEMLWKYSGYLEIFIGLFIYKTGAPKGEYTMPDPDE